VVDEIKMADHLLLSWKLQRHMDAKLNDKPGIMGTEKKAATAKVTNIG
jgi:hypothetical protein